MSRVWISIVALEVFHGLFLLLHDWVPLPPLSDVRAVRATDSTTKLLLATVISSAAFVLGLYFSLAWNPQPGWVLRYLRISYGFLFLGELQAWWIPYLVSPNPERATRYRLLFGNTHSFLPERNGITPNTLHVVLHAATLALLVLLFVA